MSRIFRTKKGPRNIAGSGLFLGPALLFGPCDQHHLEAEIVDGHSHALWLLSQWLGSRKGHVEPDYDQIVDQSDLSK